MAEEEESSATKKKEMRQSAREVQERVRRRALVLTEDDKEFMGDPHAFEAAKFREEWNQLWATDYGFFEDTTRVGPMRYTDEPVPPKPSFYVRPFETIQIFSVRVEGIREDLQWPLEVFGLVAIRDSVDHNRNIVFDCTRDNCQTLTEKDSYLVLTGPTRAVLSFDNVVFEVALKVKGAIEAEDKVLSFLAVNCCCYLSSIPSNKEIIRKYTSKLSTLELSFAHINQSVEATISLQVTDGSWPHGIHGRFTAHTASIDHKKVTLLDSGDDKVSVAADGMIKLSRCVATVELEGKLTVSVLAWQGDDKANDVSEDENSFQPKGNGRDKCEFNVGFCKMEVTVAWPLLSSVDV